MMKKFLYMAAAALMLVACNSGKTTKVVAQWKENAPEKVKFIVGDMDTTVVVKDGKVEIKLPVDVTSVSRIHAGSSLKYTFISDGSTLTLDSETNKFTSSKKDGVHSRYNAYNQWKKEFVDEYNAQIEKMEKDSAEAEAFTQKTVDEYNACLSKTVKDNKDNILAAIAVCDMTPVNPDEILSLIESLPANIQALPDAVKAKKYCESLKSGE